MITEAILCYALLMLHTSPISGVIKVPLWCYVLCGFHFVLQICRHLLTTAFHILYEILDGQDDQHWDVFKMRSV